MKTNYLYTLLFALIFSFMSTGCSSDPDEGVGDNNGDDDGIASGNNLEAVISELKKDKQFSGFVKTLETMEIPSNSLTVFAILNDAIEGEDGIPEDLVKLHIIDGKYDKDALAKVQKIKALSGVELNIDFYEESGTKLVTGPDSKTIYANGIVVGDVHTESEGYMIYKMDKTIPASITPPSLSNSTEYFEWMADRMDGLWTVEDVESFTVRTDWDGYNLSRTEIPIHIEELKDLEYKLDLGFSKSNQYKTRSIYGSMEVINADGVDRIIPEFIPKDLDDELFYWGLEKYDIGQTIMMRNYRIIFSSTFQSLGRAKIHIEKGIGTYMIISTNQTGYSLYPPMMYPAEKDSTAIILRKKRNVW